MEFTSYLFEKPGPQNTEEALKITAGALSEFKASKVLVASTTGKTALKAVELIDNSKLIIISHSYGFYEPDEDEFDNEIKELLKFRGIPLITTTHTFAGFARAVRREFKTYLVEDIVAQVLRTVSEGFKVGYELVCMASDTGYLKSGERVITVAGTGEGADTVLLFRAENSNRFFDIHLEAIIAKPLKR